jgi:hypothetical protein
LFEPFPRFAEPQLFSDQTATIVDTLSLPNGTWEMVLTSPHRGLQGNVKTKLATGSGSPGSDGYEVLASWGNCVPDDESDLVRCRTVRFRVLGFGFATGMYGFWTETFGFWTEMFGFSTEMFGFSTEMFGYWTESTTVSRDSGGCKVLNGQSDWVCCRSIRVKSSRVSGVQSF